MFSDCGASISRSSTYADFVPVAADQKPKR
jgi:hypothetical protein